MGFHEQLLGVVQKASKAPFLFVGSGFSRRHMNSETWAALLQRFCECGQPFEYYASKANGSYPLAAELLANDYHHHWWKDQKFEQQRETKKSLIKTVSDPLKLEIAEYFQKTSPKDINLLAYPEEIALLKTAVIDGMVTTNWDTLLELIFPDYKPYIGQGSILRSAPTGIAEIYKIHGCCKEPRSLILTAKDYDAFTKRNHYLAAKLVAIFVEHPVVFLGYSLADSNIQEMLVSIVNCLGNDHIGLIQNRLIFVSYDKEATTPTIEPIVFQPGDTPIPITMIHTSSYEPIYKVLALVKRKIPARILRHLREQIVLLASTAEATSQVGVVDVSDSTKLEAIEFVVGVGIKSSLCGEKGFSSISAADIFNDFLHEKNLPAERLLKITVPNLLKASPYLPVFCYLRKLGIDNQVAYANSGLQIDKAVQMTHNQLCLSVSNHIKTVLAGKTFPEIVATYDHGHVLQYIPLLGTGAINPSDLRSYLRQHYDLSKAKSTNFRKAICVLDRLENKWPETTT